MKGYDYLYFYQVERAANLGSSETLQAQNGAGEYIVYVVAVDRGNGGRSEPAIAHFTLNEAAVAECPDFQELILHRLAGIDHRNNRNTGDKRQVYQGMSETNAAAGASPPPFCNPDHPNFGGPGGGQGRRRLQNDPVTVEGKVLEGLETVLETLEVCLCSKRC